MRRRKITLLIATVITATTLAVAPAWADMGVGDRTGDVEQAKWSDIELKR